MSLLLPDHDTKRDCVFKVGGRDPNASGAKAACHSDPLHSVPCDGNWFQRGPDGPFRLDDPRPSLHSLRVGTVTLRWLADAYLEVRRRLVNSLLERLRRRLRELGRPLNEGPASDGGRNSSNPNAGDAPQRRTEIKPTSRPSARDGDRTGNQGRPPEQQPPAPNSTRLKAAVFAKRRHSAPQRQAGSLWGPTSILGIGDGEARDAQTERLALTPSQGFGGGVESAPAPLWAPDQPLPPFDVRATGLTPLAGAEPLDGAYAFGSTTEFTWTLPDTLKFGPSCEGNHPVPSLAMDDQPTRRNSSPQ